MPGPGYSEVEWITGPANLYFNVDVPTSGALLSLDPATGEPSTGIGAGFLEEGVEVGAAWERAPEEADPAQNGLRLWSVTRLAIGGRLVQARNRTNLEKVLTAAKHASEDVGGDDRLFTFGQARAPRPNFSVLAVWAVWTAGNPLPGWGYALIYSAVNMTDFTLGLRRDAQAGLTFSFVGDPIFYQPDGITTRPYADRIGHIYMG